VNLLERQCLRIGMRTSPVPKRLKRFYPHWAFKGISFLSQYTVNLKSQFQKQLSLGRTKNGNDFKTGMKKLDHILEKRIDHNSKQIATVISSS
jgi:hypothetical protein